MRPGRYSRPNFSPHKKETTKSIQTPPKTYVVGEPIPCYAMHAGDNIVGMIKRHSMIRRLKRDVFHYVDTISAVYGVSPANWNWLMMFFWFWDLYRIEPVAGELNWFDV